MLPSPHPHTHAACEAEAEWWRNGGVVESKATIHYARLLEEAPGTRAGLSYQAMECLS